MKKYILLSALSLAMLGWSACQEDENEAALNVAPNGKSLTFTASVSGSNSLSKTAISANGSSIVFADGEQMTVFPNVGSAFIISNSADEENSFSGVAGDEAFFYASNFVAMYPSGALENGEYVMTIPQAQNVVSGTFDPKANLLIAETSSKDMSLQMHNVCSYIKVNINFDASYIKVTADQSLAGKVLVSTDGYAEMIKGVETVTLSGNITPGTYYIAVMPGKVTNLKITTDIEAFETIEVSEFDFEAGHIYGLEIKLFSPADIVDYVNASDKEVVTLNMPLETYDHTEVMMAIERITDKKVRLVVPEGVKELSLVAEKCPMNEYGFPIYPQANALVSVDVPKGVTSIGNYAFNCCTGLTSITIPEGVTSIGNYAFYRCSGLTSISIPESVTSIGEFAFEECALISITIPEGVTSIEQWTFAGCYSLASVSIPESVTSIGNKAFYVCPSLTIITIPGSVTSIGESAFNGCSGLTTITIPESVTFIGEDAFSRCNKLETIYCSQAIYDKYHETWPQMVVK